MKMQEIKGTTEVGMSFIRQEEIDSGMQVHNLAPPRNHYSCTVSNRGTDRVYGYNANKCEGRS